MTSLATASLKELEEEIVRRTKKRSWVPLIKNCLGSGLDMEVLEDEEDTCEVLLPIEQHYIFSDGTGVQKLIKAMASSKYESGVAETDERAYFWISKTEHKLSFIIKGQAPLPEVKQ